MTGWASSNRYGFVVGLALFLTAATGVAQSAPEPKPKPEPWRLGIALGAPKWLFFTGASRIRYEQVLNPFRAGHAGVDRALCLRTNLLTVLRLAPFRIGVELLDSRAYLAEQNAPINTTVVNPIDLLQGYLLLEVDDLLIAGSDAHLRVGRFTMDVGARRLVARNRFRNTINTFTGVELLWSERNSWKARAFATLPVSRLPSDTEQLLQNREEPDRESFDLAFWGVFVASPPIIAEIVVEGVVLGLHERDGPDRATRNRNLGTSGIRIVRRPAPGEIDFEVESVLQIGSSRASKDPDDETDLLHLATLQHLAVGYTLPFADWFRVVAQYDYASGDADPEDEMSGRFDTLFGARRFELGPTGIYGAFARHNIHTPALRIEVDTGDDFDGFIAYRPFMLAQERDAWTTSGVRDPSGAAGLFVGHQIEGRLRWSPLPRNLRLEVGGAYLVRERFLYAAPNANRTGDPVMVYLQMFVWI